LLNKYWIDEIYDAAVVRPLLAISRWVYWGFDLGVIDGAANGIAKLSQWFAAGGVRTSTGRFRIGAVTFALGCVVAIGWILVTYIQTTG
jgi:NADH-quinone oxidoreductase subunit L